MNMVIRKPDGVIVTYHNHSAAMMSVLTPHRGHTIAMVTDNFYDYDFQSGPGGHAIVKDKAYTEHYLKCYTCDLNIFEFTDL